MKQLRLIALCLLIVSLLPACSSKTAHKDSEKEGPAAAVQTHSYVAVGTVKSIDPKGPAIEIDHEEIKGLMPAMQMQFHVKDKLLLEGVAPGDRVSFTIESGVRGLNIISIHKM